MVVSKSKDNLKGTMVLSNSDQATLNQNKEALSQTLTDQLQADSKNSNSKVAVNDVRPLSDGTLALDYECTGVSDGETAKQTLHKAVQGDDVKKAIGKSATNGSNADKSKPKATQQPGKSNPPSFPLSSSRRAASNRSSVILMAEVSRRHQSIRFFLFNRSPVRLPM